MAENSFNQITGELSKEENSYLDLVNSLPQGIFEADLTGKITFLNNSAFLLLGLNKDDLSKPLYLSNFIHPDFHSQLNNNIKLLLETKTVRENEYTAIRKDGSSFPIISYSSLLLEGEKPIALRGIVVDITDRKKVEAELKQSEKNFFDLFNQSPVPMVLAASDGKILHINERFTRVFGYTIDDISTIEDWWALAYPDLEIRRKTRTHWHNLIENAFNNGGEIQPAEFLVRCKDGADRHVIIEAKILNKNILTSFFDITERKLASVAVNKSEEMLRNIIHTVPDLIVKTDLEGKIVFINDNTIPFLRNYPTAKLLGKNFRSFISDEDLERVNINVQNMFKSQLGIQEYKIKLEDDTQLICEINGSVIRNYNMEPVELVFVIRDITERKLAEEKIKSNEAFINNLLRTLPIPVFYKDVEGKYINVNDAFISLFGNNKEEFVGKSVYDLYPTEIAKTYFEKDNELLKSGGTQVYEFVFHDSNGKDHNAIFHKATFEDHEHKVAGLIGAILDITEQKLIEEGIRASNERWESLFNNSPNSIGIYEAIDSGIDFKFTDLNLKAQKMTYLTHEEVIGKRVTELFPGVKENDLLPALRRVWQTGKTEFIKTNYVKEKHLEGWIENTIYKLNTGEVVAIYNDVTENVVAQKALQESEEKFRTMFENANDAVLILGMHEVMDCNLRTLEMFGCSKEQLKGIPPNKLSPPFQPDGNDSREKAYEKISLTLTGLPQRFEWKYLKYDGTPFDADVSFNKLELHGQTFIQAIIRDISEKKKNECELEKYREHLESLVETRTQELDQLNSDLIAQLQKEKELELMLKNSLAMEKELNELKSRFISTASHEFRTPLTTIYSSVQLLEKYGKSWNQEMNTVHFARIKEYVQYMTTIMDDVLTISRADSGKIKFDPAMMDLNHFCLNLVTDLNTLLTNNHKLVFNYTIKKKKFNLDEKLLKYILLNLLSNAIKYSPNGGKITFKVSKIEDSLNFTIEDEGIGIPEKDQPFLFDSFHRGDNVFDIQGTGLGMSIVKRSIDMHGGTISFTSKLNLGTKFIVTIPV